MARHEVVLLDNASATGDWKPWPGGDGRVDVCGSIGGATLTLQVKGCDGTTAHTVGTDTTFTAVGSNGFKLEAGCEIRVAVSGGTPSALFASAYRI